MLNTLCLLPQRLLLLLVRGYRLLLSPWLGSSCRFTPTCSAYALESLERHGALAGSVLTVRRLARCHPWCEGGHDAVPTEPPGWLMRRAANRGSERCAPPSFPSPDKTSP